MVEENAGKKDEDVFAKKAAASTEKKAKADGKPIIFLWPRPIARRVMVLAQKLETMTTKGAVAIAGSGKSIDINFGIYETDDPKYIDALRSHASFGHAKKDRTFREATEEEAGVITMLRQSKIPQSEILRRMKAIRAAQDPSKKV